MECRVEKFSAPDVNYALVVAVAMGETRVIDGLRAVRGRWLWPGVFGALLALVLALAAGAGARESVRPIVLQAGDSASYTGMRAACAVMSRGHGRTLLGVLCYERAPQGSTLGPFENASYQVVLRLDGLTQMWQVDAHGFPDRPVFSHPPGAPLGAYDLGQGTKHMIRTLELGFVLGRTSLRCKGAVLGITAPGERVIACAFATPAGTPRPNSWGVAISDLAAYVVHFDAAGHAASAFSRRQPPP